MGGGHGVDGQRCMHDTIIQTGITCMRRDGWSWGDLRHEDRHVG